MLHEITSNQNPKLKAAIQLHQSRGRRKQNRIIIFGWREVERALSAGISIEEVFVCKTVASPETIAQIQLRADRQFQEICSVPELLFKKLQYGDRSDGVVATAARPVTELSDLEVSDSAFFLVLQGIEKPGNLGAIVRTADGAGANGIIVADAITDAFHPNAIRASMGTVFSVPLANATSEEVLAWLQDHDIQAVVARPDATNSFYNVDLTGKLALVMGNEADGLTDQWNRSTFKTARLPMNGIADSLNVSVSASIMAYEAYRQRRVNG